jgi:zinc protease
MNSFTLTTILAMTTLFNTAAPSQDNLDRSKRPIPQKTPAIKLPEIQKSRLSNGLGIWLVEQHELPIVSLDLVVQAGSDHDPLAKPGIASMTADILDEGTTSRDALKIADELDFIGASLRIHSDLDGSYALLNTITRHLDEALTVYADVLLNPSFPQKDFERIRKQRETALLQQKDRASTIASNAFQHIIYGSNHPYGNNSSGNEKSLAEMTRDDLVAFYGTYYRPNNATMIVVGDVTLKDISSRLERLLSAWKPGTIPRVEVPDAPIVNRATLYLIDKPGAAQSEIRIGYPAVSRSTPDFFALNLLNRVLGGQFTSRLNLNLREKHGFTYGARSRFVFARQPGPFVASSGVTTSKTDSALSEFKYEIDRTCKDGVTAEELSFVKKGYAGSFALNFETPSQIAGAIQDLVLYNLPDNYYNTYLQNVDITTLHEVNDAAKRYLNSSTMAFVVVGDLKVIQDGCEKLGIEESVLCDADGNRITK